MNSRGVGMAIPAGAVGPPARLPFLFAVQHIYCINSEAVNGEGKKVEIPVMKQRALTRLAISLGYLLCSAQAAMATQAHGGPEGLYVHQMAHILFIFSLAVLIYWLREHSLIKEPGWRYVQYAAFFLILWNIDAVLAHYLDGRRPFRARR